MEIKEALAKIKHLLFTTATLYLFRISAMETMEGMAGGMISHHAVWG